MPGLQWAPSYEQEVALLFGVLLPHLDGLSVIEEASDSFPDCLAIDERGRRVRIEFEVMASEFRVHGHDPKGCDLIVCWQNDWPVVGVRVGGGSIGDGRPRGSGICGGAGRSGWPGG